MKERLSLNLRSQIREFILNFMLTQMGIEPPTLGFELRTSKIEHWRFIHSAMEPRWRRDVLTSSLNKRLIFIYDELHPFSPLLPVLLTLPLKALHCIIEKHSYMVLGRELVDQNLTKSFISSMWLSHLFANSIWINQSEKLGRTRDGSIALDHGRRKVRGRREKAASGKRLLCILQCPQRAGY